MPLYEVEQETERVILVGVSQQDGDDAEDSVEAVELLEVAGGVGGGGFGVGFANEFPEGCEGFGGVEVVGDGGVELVDEFGAGEWLGWVGSGCEGFEAVEAVIEAFEGGFGGGEGVEGEVEWLAVVCGYENEAYFASGVAFCEEVAEGEEVAE